MFYSVTFSVFTVCAAIITNSRTFCHPKRNHGSILKACTPLSQPHFPLGLSDPALSLSWLCCGLPDRAARAVPSCSLSPPSSLLLHLFGNLPFLFITWDRIWGHVEMENMDFAEPTWIHVLELTFINLVTWASPRTLPCGQGYGELPFPPSCTGRVRGCSPLEYVSDL